MNEGLVRSRSAIAIGDVFQGRLCLFAHTIRIQYFIITRTLCTMRCAEEGAASSCATALPTRSVATSAQIARRITARDFDIIGAVTLCL